MCRFGARGKTETWGDGLCLLTVMRRSGLAYPLFDTQKDVTGMTPFEGFTLAGIVAVFVTMIGAIARWASNKIDDYDRESKHRIQELINLIEQKDKLASQREERQSKEITELRTDQRALEIEIRNELVGLLRDTKDALHENSTILKDVLKDMNHG